MVAIWYRCLAVSRRLATGIATGNLPRLASSRFRNPTNDWLRGGVEEQQSFVTGGGAGNDAFAVPEIADPQLVSNDMGQGNAIGSGQGNMQANGAGTTNVPAEGPSMPFWVLGCAVAIGSVVGNMYQWLNIVDLRNKYRVALRRTSPSFRTVDGELIARYGLD